MDSKLNYKRIVIKIGSSSLTHAETGRLNLAKMEHLVRQLSDLHNQGMDVCLVSSGAIAVGRAAMGVKERPSETSVKQACAAVGQAKLMMVYQKLFAEYSQTAGQILLTKNTMVNPVSRANAKNTFDELFHLGVIPVVNENDQRSSTYEMHVYGVWDNCMRCRRSLLPWWRADNLSSCFPYLNGAICKTFLPAPVAISCNFYIPQQQAQDAYAVLS